MPIKFRCPHCRQFLGISRNKAGEIADCPMCGKTLRVPDLDGTVKPLPKPELDLRDSSLVNALGELASIGAPEQAPSATDESAPAIHEPVTVRPAPEPIELEPLQAAAPVAVVKSPRPSRRQRRRGAQETSSSDSAEATLDELGGSAEAFPVLPSPRRKQTRSTALRLRWISIGAAAGVIVLSGIGFLIFAGGSDESGGDVDASNGEIVGAAENPVAPAAVVDTQPAITGRVTYVSEAGDTRPDDGSHIIALPKARGGTVKLDVAGFMVGSGGVDFQVAVAALNALGGDLVTADENGDYAIHLDEAGEYQLLVISRHQSRPWQVGVESDVQLLLDRFFIRPSTLLGQLAYQVQDVQYRGQGTSPRDISFPRE